MASPMLDRAALAHSLQQPGSMRMPRRRPRWLTIHAQPDRLAKRAFDITFYREEGQTPLLLQPSRKSNG